MKKKRNLFPLFSSSFSIPSFLCVYDEALAGQLETSPLSPLKYDEGTMNKTRRFFYECYNAALLTKCYTYSVPDRIPLPSRSLLPPPPPLSFF